MSATSGFKSLKIKPAKKNSAGFGALQSALRHVSKYMSPKSTLKTVAHLNQKKGFDCPGCAWPDPDDDRAFLSEYCENGLKAMAEEAQNKTIGAAFFKQYSVSDLNKWSDFELGKSGRLAEPLFLEQGDTNYRPISWESAFTKIADKLNALATPNEAVFYTSGRTSNEAAFLYQLFVRQFGTNNLPDCSNMCHEASGKALGETLGIGKGSVTLDDLHKAELILVVGQNPGTNHPRMLSALEKCKKNGGKIISINPLAEAGLIKFTNPQKPLKLIKGGVSLTDIHIPLKINTDVAFVKAIMLLLLKKEEQGENIFDHEFIQQYTSGYEIFKNDLKKYHIKDCLKQAGISLVVAQEMAELIAQRSKIVVCWAMGLTQHRNAVDNIRELVNLLLLKGSIGKEGAGTCPVRGHSNVQGDRTVGIWEAAPQAFLDKIEAKYGFKPQPKHGYSVVDAIKALYNKKARVFFALGGNFYSAAPDSNYTAKALNNCDLTVHVSTKLNRSHLITGKEALILPCLGRSEKDEQNGSLQLQSVENSMGIVSATRGVLQPCSEKLKSEVAIICGIAEKVLRNRTEINWKSYIENYSLIRDDIEQVVAGFEDYNNRLQTGFYLPNGARDRLFKTKTGKARFTLNKLPDWKLEKGQFMMMTIRSHDQFNTTVYGLNDRYRGIYNGRRVVFMNREDIEEQGLKKQELVNLESVWEGEVRKAENFAVVPYDIPKNCCATYFPETNVLVPINSYAHTAKTPASKSVIVRIKKSKSNS